MNDRASDFELLCRFVRRADQDAFAELVHRHLNLVYATAIRKTEDQSSAEEIAQNVFATFARKAWQFSRDDSVAAWLYKTTLLEAKEWWRSELRRRRRDQAAVELGAIMKTPEEEIAFRALLPLLDDALLSLREKDRTALLLRFYEDSSLREVGAHLGISEDAAQKRVASALEKLMRFFEVRGFRTATLAATTAALRQTAVSAPAFMNATVTTTALNAAPAVTGVKLLLTHLYSLTLLQKAACLALLLAIPAGWIWKQQANERAGAPIISTAPAQVTAAPAPQVDAPPETAMTVQPVVQTAITASPAASSKSAPTSRKEYSVRVLGFINTSDSKVVYLEITHHSYEASGGRAMVVQKIVASDGEFDDQTVPDGHVHFEILEANFETWSIRLRENGVEATYRMNDTIPRGRANVWLAGVDFNQAVDFYAWLLDRTVICNPGLPRTLDFTMTGKARTRSEATAEFKVILQTKAQVSTLLVGDKFAVLVPTNHEQTISAMVQALPVPDGSTNLVPANTIDFQNVTATVAANFYSEFTGRKLYQLGRRLPFTFSFRNQTPLTKAEVIYAFNLIFRLNGYDVDLVSGGFFLSRSASTARISPTDVGGSGASQLNVLELSARDVVESSVRIATQPDTPVQNVVFRYRGKTPAEIEQIVKGTRRVRVLKNEVAVAETINCAAYTSDGTTDVGLVLILNTYEEAKITARALKGE